LSTGNEPGEQELLPVLLLKTGQLGGSCPGHLEQHDLLDFGPQQY